MPEEFTLTVHTPEGSLLQEQPLYMLSATSESGSFGLLKGHQPVIASLKKGQLFYQASPQSDKRSLPLKSGILSSDGYSVIVMTQ